MGQTMTFSQQALPVVWAELEAEAAKCGLTAEEVLLRAQKVLLRAKELKDLVSALKEVPDGLRLALLTCISLALGNAPLARNVLGEGRLA